MLKRLIKIFKLNFLSTDELYNLYFIKSLNEKDYPKVLKRLCQIKLNRKLNLSKPKTFTDKIQWLKLYDTNPLKRVFTDKIFVREWINEQIGSEYLIPVLQICKDFDSIDFKTLPESFTIKTNHAENWEYFIKNKTKLLGIQELFNFTRNKFNTWQNDSYHYYNWFEMSYKGIMPKLMVEEPIKTKDTEIYRVYCFNGEPKFSEYIRRNPFSMCIYDEDFKLSKYNFNIQVRNTYIEPNELIKKAFELSKKLSKDFKFVCVEWTITDGKIYFERMNFAPQSGLIIFEDEQWDKELGELIKL